ncbi:MAG: hypothetical protein KKC46_17240 [Proteobacteria bacterium]|nr:hypothetical protein [Pseudomonadota bacterium]
MNDSNKTIVFNYKFKFNNNFEKEFNVELDSKTLNLTHTPKSPAPEWAKLNFFKCPNCTLDETKHLLCPIAANLVELVDFFRNMISYSEVDMQIQCKERGYFKHTTLQQGISSLIGIYMVTSGCHVMEKLKPMVRYHLPFASMLETEYRALSMYLLAQYFLYKQGKQPDWDLKHLVDIYSDIQIVNKSISRRLTNISIQDAALNALIKLDIFAKRISVSIDRNILDEIENLFGAYF